MGNFLRLSSVLFLLLSLGTCAAGGPTMQGPGAILMLIAFVAFIGSAVIDQLRELRKDLREK